MTLQGLIWDPGSRFGARIVAKCRGLQKLNYWLWPVRGQNRYQQ